MAGAHRLAAGVSYDRANNDFEQSEAESDLDTTRAVLVTEAPEVNALITGRSRTASVYLSDIVTLAPGLTLTLSRRYNDTRVRTVDLGRTSLGLDTTLDGEGKFTKFNPAAGLTWQITPALTAYGGFSQGNRAPSPIELGCFGSGMRWNASVFRTDNRDDLLFISNGRSAGYFTNFGRTRRQGVELSVSQQSSAIDWSLSYSYLRATFESMACLLSESNSSAETSPACDGDDEIEMRPGNRLPGLLSHSLKLNVDKRPMPNWSVGLQFAAYSSQFVRGNENNANRADGIDFFGAGKVGGFALVNLTSNRKLDGGWELFAKVSNLFDRRDASGGLLAENAFDPRGNLRAPADWRNEFAAPGAPRALWVGARWSFDAPG